MSEVPAGWYPVPDDPRTLRYWDGSTWTDHTHTFDEAVGLGSISQMISEGFNALGKYLQPVLVLSLGASPAPTGNFRDRPG